MSAFPENEPSLCIPRVFPNLSWSFIKDKIEGEGWGTVERVDIVKKENSKGEAFNRVFIHFKKWNDDENTTKIRNLFLEDSDGVKLVYEKNWFWIIRKSNVPRPTFVKKNTINTTIQSDSQWKKTTTKNTSTIKPSIHDSKTLKKMGKTIDFLATEAINKNKQIEQLSTTIAQLKLALETLQSTNGTSTPTYCPSPPATD
jgi:hypothetical protein